MPPLGGAERAAGRAPHTRSQIFPPYLSWFPDSSALVVVHARAPRQRRQGSLWSRSRRGEQRPLTTPDGFVSDHEFPAVSPDGRTVAFRRGPTLSVLALRPDFTPAAEPRRSQTRRVRASPTWTPDGKEIVYSRVGASGGSTRQASIRPRPLPFGGQDAIMPVISRPVAGKPSTTGLRPKDVLTRISGVSTSPHWARRPVAPVLLPILLDHDRLQRAVLAGRQTVAFQSNRSGRMEIWVADADGANAAQLTAMGAWAAQHRHPSLVSRRTDDCVRFQAARAITTSMSCPPAAGSPRRADL